MGKPGAPQKRPGAAAAAKRRWKDPTNRQRFRLPNVPRTRVYTLLSLLLLVVLGLVFLFDILQLAVREHPDATTQLFSVAILILHTTAIGLGLLPLLYYRLMQQQNRRFTRQAVAAVAGNVLLLVLRIIFESLCCQFREERYAH